MTFAGARRRLLAVEAAAFAAVAVLLWLDEVLDLPHHLLGAPPTPVNWRESLLESACVAALWVVTAAATYRLLRRVRRLEGLVPVCSACKKIRSGVDWVSLEPYLRDHSDADFTHGICPECSEALYGDLGRRSAPPTDPLP